MVDEVRGAVRLDQRAVPTVDAGTARRWVHLAEETLRAGREGIDGLNVFPVPDGDTGTNLHLTVQQARQAVDALPPDAPLGEVCRVVARAALLGARGNSGIIVSQMLRGWADELAGRDSGDAAAVAGALTRADAQAWAAVESPVEGTMLSVTRAAAQAAQALEPQAGRGVDEVVRAAVAAARQALLDTTGQLPVLAAAGVVDAGGAGIVLILEALVSAVTGEPPAGLDLATLPDALPDRSDATPAAAAPSGATSCGAPVSGDDVGRGGQYEVMYLVEAPTDAVPALRSTLAGLGDSLVVVGGPDVWHVHVHVDDPGAAVEAGLRAGSPSSIRISHLHPTNLRHAQAADRAAATVTGTAVVAWAAGPGLATVFAECGVDAVTPPSGRRPSTAEVLDVVRAAAARAVVVLPNDPQTLAVARTAAQAARDEGLRVIVIPTRAQVQGLAAAAVHDATADTDQDVAAMSAAAGATRHGGVTVATREAITMAGRCRPGDVLGIVDGDFAVVGDDVARVAVQVVDRLLSGGGEMVTLVTGELAPPGVTAAVRAAVRLAHPTVEVLEIDGGQPRYQLLVGVE